MKKKLKLISLALITFITIFTLFPIITYANSSIELTEPEKSVIESTKNNPIKIGIIPHTFPLSECPPVTSDFVGINIEMLALMTQKTGLQFDYERIPIEEKTPYHALLDNDFSLVAGTIRLDSFTNNPNLILSERFGDGASICIAKNSTNPKEGETGKIAVLHGYQAGINFSKQKFPNHEIVSYQTNYDVLKAVRNGDADLAMISRYVGIYELQNPFNEQLTVLPPYQTIVDSCIMGVNTEENKLIMSIINKALINIGDEEYNHIQVNFTITHPYDLTLIEFLFKFRYIFIFGFIVFIVLSYLAVKLFRTQRERKTLSRDSVTGAYTESGFELAAKKVIQKSNQTLFITVFDISHFSIYNELHGKKKGDELLKKIVDIVCSFLSEQDVICRSYADNFIVLSCKENVDVLIHEIKEANSFFNELLDRKMVFSFGVYQINDSKLPISKMIDFASIAKKKVKGNTDNYICIFNNEMLNSHIYDAKLLDSFNKGIDNKEFVAYYQPKYDVYTQEVVGAEALVRWVKDDSIISPGYFIDLFEKNGQIQRLDFYMLEEVCIFLSKIINQGLKPIPISINFSRVHLFSSDFVNNIKETVERYSIPRYLIQIECTETVMTYNTELSIELLGELQELGFSIAMDDFGKAYSALNTLRAMPLDVVKLDSDFFSSTLDEEISKAKKIISGVVSLVHDLSLKIVAEGVETESQYLFLKEIGCDYIQGFYFSKPLEEKVFFDLITKDK